MGRADYEAKTVPELQKELERRGLDTDGRKAELVDRLVDDDKAKAEELTVDELQDELRDADLPVSGNKDELVERLAEGPVDEDEDEDADDDGRAVIHAGGHVVHVDPPPPPADPIETCSICGEPENCIHKSGQGTAWAIAQPPEHQRTEDPESTFAPNETRASGLEAPPLKRKGDD